MSEPNPTGSVRSRRVLDIAFVAAFMIAALQLAMLPSRGAGVWWVGSGAAVLISVAGCWVLLRASRPGRGSRLVTLVLMVLAASLPLLVDGPAAWPMFLLGLLMFLPVWGTTATAVIIVGLGGAQAVVLLASGQGPAVVVAQTVSTMLIFGCGLAAAWLVADHDRQRQEIVILLAERERDFERESELMLARERTRAARDLHDGLGHRLTLITMALQFARDARTRQPDRAWSQVDQAQSLARQALDHMRRWVRALDPPASDGSDPLDQIVSTFGSTGLQIEVDTVGSEQDAGNDERLYLRRLVQEGLTNTLRHSDADRVRIERRIDAAGVRIALLDGDPSPAVDQAGSESGLPAVEPGYGLRSLSERAQELGGVFRCGRTASGGFLIEADLPARNSPSTMLRQAGLSSGTP